MNDIEFIKELDKRIELVHDAWADELIALLNDEKIEEGSAKYEKRCKQLSKKYAPLIADILLIRDEVFERAYQKQEADYANQFVASETDRGETDDSGRPLDVYWKDGQWHKYKRPKTDKKD